MSATKKKNGSSVHKNKRAGGTVKKPHVSNKWLVAVTVALATFMEVMDDTSVSVALAQIGGNLSAGQDEVTWVVTSQLVAKAVVLPLSGWLATVVGRMRLFATCLVLYGVTSFFCGISPSIEVLVIVRILQGMAGGVLSPMAQAILVDAFPAKQRGLAFAAYGIAVVVAPVIGPTLGGWIVDNYSWNWVFFINVPVAAMTAFLVTTLVADPPEFMAERAARFKNGLSIDYVGLGLLAVGLGALQLVLSEGQDEDWFDSAYITLLAVLAFVSLGVGVLWEFLSDDPIIELRLIKDRTFAAALVVMFAVGVTLFGSSTVLPLFMQTLLGYTPTLAGLALSPGGIASLLMMPVVGILVSKVQARWLILAGLVITAFAFWRFAHVINPQIAFSTIAWVRMIQTAAIGFFFIPVNTAAYATIPKSKNTQASTIISIALNLGGSFGIAAATTLLARRAQFHQARITENLTVFDSAYQAAARNLSGVFGAQGMDAAAANTAAQTALYGNVVRQAGVLAYVDIFYVLAIACVCTLPLVLLMRPNKPGAGGAEGVG